ncbi:YbfB/YjiJ family MFS transporter [Telmatospirillum sp.]|uniref:YbfB/YjiJ family MFS transporter n=1 Tax=Telmatospirillum sp. TaxID=2079197 RepID=UPI00283E9FF7|nr:YbfB/YjiJ family MFS transporter [Telmatospirillum sp.]MDR3440913.1 YbfB/YjiJ family MFS transporter [Telmatospirillum sp.]
MRKPNVSPLLVALAGCLSLAVAMGGGRFAFTALYPAMVTEGRLSVADGSIAASANYAGYLAGALFLVRLPPARASLFCLVGLALTTICLAGMAVATSPQAIDGIRFVAGIASAIVLIAATVWLMQSSHGDRKAGPILYAGVGTGIAASAELAALASSLDWPSGTAWGLLAALSLIATLAVGAASLVRPPRQEPAGQGQSVPDRQRPSPNCTLAPSDLIWIYGLAGFGYIISATYLPLIVGQALGPGYSLHLWAAFGLGAAPSCLVWHLVHVRLGTAKALAINYGIQALGVLMPTLTSNAALLVFGAVLVGGTFMGVVTIAMSAARTVAGKDHASLASFMTAAYGLGQIVGPVVAQHLFTVTKGFGASLVVAASSLVIGSTIAVVRRMRVSYADE